MNSTKRKSGVVVSHLTYRLEQAEQHQCESRTEASASGTTIGFSEDEYPARSWKAWQTMNFIILADCKDPDDTLGRTYREVNAAKTHNIQIGALVEVGDEDYPGEDDGIRLWVVFQGRDCDQTPMYWSVQRRTIQSESVARFSRT